MGKDGRSKKQEERKVVEKSMEIGERKHKRKRWYKEMGTEKREISN